MIEGSIPRNFSSISEYISIVFEVMHVEDRILMSPPEVRFLPLRIVKFVVNLFADYFIKHGVIEEFSLFSIGEIVGREVSFTSKEFPLLNPKEVISHTNNESPSIEMFQREFSQEEK